jgi:HD superfamily phosphohydrolase YqeK
MHSGDLRLLKEWFGGFCRAYYSEVHGEQMNIVLKEKHSRNVAENAFLIARAESFDDNGLLLAETAGLLHDVGRFPQYAKYKTFKDADSINHGKLGAATLKEDGILDCIEEKERDLIIEAVRFHNVFAVPAAKDENATQFIRLVRDADKLDIWRVFCDYYEGGEESGADAVPLGLPDLPEYSRGALDSIMRKEIVRLGCMKTLSDLKLLQLSWVFDINFKASFRLASDRGSIQRLAAALPQTEDILRAVAVVDKYVSQRAEEN